MHRLRSHLSLLFCLSTLPGFAQTFNVVAPFPVPTGGNAPAANPFYSGLLAQGRDGNLYGGATNAYQGNVGTGETFRVTLRDEVITTLCDFNGALGAQPQGGLTLGSDGNFYGTASDGGADGYGTIFVMTPAGTCSSSPLYTFTGGNDGGEPIAPPIEGIDSNYYGTTASQTGESTAGTIYKVTRKGVFTALHTCTGTDCNSFQGPLTLAADGNFYGTSEQGGSAGQGNIFRISAEGNFTSLHSFDGTHGLEPTNIMTQGTDGSFYGTTQAGGSKGSGVAFKFTPPHGFKVLHSLNGTTDGTLPYSGLVQATDGNFYGAAEASGNNGADCGTLFRITPSGVFTVIHTFAGTDGCNPYSALYQHTNGLIYGTTYDGGNSSAGCEQGCGVVYSLNIGSAPFVTFAGPPAAKVGKTIEILGQGLTGATGVLFNGTAATTFKVASDTYMTATVPSGATTGTVIVNAPAGALSSNIAFRVLP